MKFIHAADIHLDSPLVGLHKYEGAPVEELRGATRRALSNLVDLTLEEEAAFLLIAGDLFDGDWKDYNTALFFLKEMNRLRKACIPVIWVAGNHDAISIVTKQLKPPKEVQQLSHRKPQTVVLEDAGVAVHGQSFSSRAVDENIASAYPQAVKGLFNIGLLHTSVNGREGHDNYAPCTLDDLRGKGYEYWALGHVHKHEILSKDPWVVFPGNIQGRNIRETGEKGCVVVTVEDNAVVNVEQRALDVLRWELATIKAPPTGSPHDLLDEIEKALNDVRDKNNGLTLAARVLITGECAAHRTLLANPERWTAEVRAIATGAGDNSVWIEKVKFETSPLTETSSISNMDGPVKALVSALDRLAPRAEELVLLKKELKDLFGKLPELQGQINLEDDKTITELAESVKQMLLASIHEEEVLS
jgi:DNA repair exonuclease SbcCD nuclease subunit